MAQNQGARAMSSLRAFLLGVLVLLWSLPLGAQSKPPVQTQSFVAMATKIDLTVVDAERAEARSALRLVERVFSEVEQEMSEWKRSSPLSRVNKEGAMRPVKVPSGLFQVMRRALAVSEMSAGAFDPTWAGLWGLWDFRVEKAEPPTQAQIAQRLPLVDYRAVVLDAKDSTIRLKRSGVLIGLGGIAKGYALERAQEELLKRGFSNFAISAGGQVLVRGQKAGRKWRVGIRNPRGPLSDNLAVLSLTNRSVSTSGDYERYFMYRGLRYHHILDPKTGRPARGLRSATVVSADPLLADALSTALMVMGKQRGLRLIESLSGVEAVLIDHQGKAISSSGVAPMIRWKL